MSTDFVATEPTYWIAHEPGQLNYGFADVGQHVTTGLQNFETFNRYMPYRARLLELGWVPEE